MKNIYVYKLKLYMSSGAKFVIFYQSNKDELNEVTKEILCELEGYKISYTFFSSTNNKTIMIKLNDIVAIELLKMKKK